MRYSLTEIATGKVLRTRDFAGEPPVLAAAKGFQWEPYVAPAPVPPTPEQIKNQFTLAVKSRLNAKALEHRYDDYHAAMGYVGSPVQKFHEEAVRFRDWVSLTWAAVETIESDVEAGRRTLPSLEQFLSELPQF
jgi:hypothetical protein